MFGAILGYLDGAVAKIDHGLVHSLDLMPHHKGIASGGCGPPTVETNTALNLLQTDDCVALSTQLCHSLDRVGEITPSHTDLGAKRRLVDFCRRGCGRDTTQT